ncbi:MAG: PilZ domain-containing protein [Magnetococcales bacterium]|nr:PilZ domain-containing protein [Magnetococcales bacterium]
MANQPALEPYELIVGNASECTKLLAAALTEGHPVQVEMSNDAILFYSRFENELERMEDIVAGRFLEIGPLDPPVGNIRIRRSEYVNLHFFTTRHVAEAQVKFLEMSPTRCIRLSVPEKLFLNRQKRTAFRVDVEPSWRLTVKVIRPSGISFLANPLDLSIGGMRLVTLGPVPKMSNNARIEVVVDWKERGIQATAKAKILQQIPVAGNISFRLQFLISSSKQAQLFENLVTALQRRRIEKRKELFGKT